MRLSVARLPIDRMLPTFRRHMAMQAEQQTVAGVMAAQRGRKVRRHRRRLVEIAAAHGVTDLRVFGSVARG